MAWSNPRTWTTGETVTAALLNTEIRNNFQVTAPAKITTAGDLVYGSSANALLRLGIGASNKFLRGGATAPAWSDTLGDATNSGLFTVKGTGPKIRLSETDAPDSNDFWETTLAASDIIHRFWDDSASVFRIAAQLAPEDLMLHTSQFGTAAGAFIVAQDSSGSTGLTTGGTGNLAVTITTGGPAFVMGWFSIALTRSAAGSAGDEVRFVPQNDAAPFSAAFNLTENNDWADAMIPSNGDTGIYSGAFWSRVTSSDTSTWSVNLSASVNSVFVANSSQLLLVSIQYPL